MDYIRALGTSGTLATNRGTTCFQISHNTLIDAGNIIESLGDAANEIEHIFLTHSHFDHISDIPALLDLFFTTRTNTLHIYALEETLIMLKESLFNEAIFPDFSNIDLLNGSGKSIKYHSIQYYKKYHIKDITLTPFPTNHTVASCGYIIKKQDQAILFTSDTGNSKEIYKIINQDHSIQTLITEVSFPSEYEDHAKLSLHLTPKMLLNEIKQLTRKDISILVMHLKPNFEEQIIQELKHPEFQPYNITVLQDGDIIPYDKKEIRASKRTIYNKYKTLLKTGSALTEEKDLSKLSELILQSARDLTQADAGTLYILSDDEKYLQFQAVQNNTLGDIDNSHWDAISLYNDGIENHTLVTTHCALSKKLFRIDDIYNSSKEFDFYSTIEYDKRSGYTSISMLLVPLLDYDKNLIGVLQLINKLDHHHKIIPFNKNDEEVISSLGSQAAIFLTNQKLIDDLELLFESFLNTITLALDKKSPHMKGHIKRMVELTMMLVNRINEDKDYFPDITYDELELKTIKIAAMMHDIGKITTPVYIIDKAKKLEKIIDRIEIIKLRFKLFKNRQTKNQFTNDEIEEMLQFLEEANCGQEFFTDEQVLKVKEIAKHTIKLEDEEIPLLSEDEVKNLTIQKGTLTEEERKIINYHATMSIEMLNSIKFPKKYKRVPEIAGNHHEKINGKGYPNQLKGDEISFEARILAIADIFEAVTSSDRSYKKTNTLSTSMKILWHMANDNDIDRDICKFFYESGLYLEYANQFMLPEYIDKVEMDFSFS